MRKDWNLWTRRTLMAALACVALVALTSCGGGGTGSGPPVTVVPPNSTPTQLYYGALSATISADRCSVAFGVAVDRTSKSDAESTAVNLCRSNGGRERDCAEYVLEFGNKYSDGHECVALVYGNSANSTGCPLRTLEAGYGNSITSAVSDALSKCDAKGYVCSHISGSNGDLAVGCATGNALRNAFSGVFTPDTPPSQPPSNAIPSNQVGNEFGTTSTSSRPHNLSCGNDVVFSHAGTVVLPSVDIVSLPQEAGTVTFDYEAYQIPDRFVVQMGGQIVVDTQYVGTSRSVAEVNQVLRHYGFQPTTQASIISPGRGSRSFQKPAGVTSAIVRVYAPLTGTRWEVEMKFSSNTCPGSGGGVQLPPEPTRSKPPQAPGSDLPNVEIAGAGTTEYVQALNTSSQTVNFQQGTWFEPKDGQYQRMIIASSTSVPPGRIVQIPTACMQRSNDPPAIGARLFSRPKPISGSVQQCQRNCLSRGGTIQTCVWGCETPTPTNRAPVVAHQLQDLTIQQGSTRRISSISSAFSDPDGDPLTITPSSNSPSHATARVSGGDLIIEGVRGFTGGAVTITVTARDPSGLTAELTFDVRVSVPQYFYGAISFGWKGSDKKCADGYASLINSKYPDQNSADSDALQSCRDQGGRNCIIARRFGSGYTGNQQCAALAYGENSSRCQGFAHSGSTKSEARSNALSACRSYGFTSCIISPGVKGPQVGCASE